MGRSARSIGPSRCRTSRKKGAYAVSPAKNICAPPAISTNPPHRARLRSSGLRAEKCCAGVRVIGSAEVFDSCHQSSSSTRRIPDDRTSAPFPRGVITTGIEALRELAERPQIAMVVMVVTEQHHRDGRQVVERHGRLPDSPRADHVQRTGALGVHGVGQDVPRRCLNQKRRVTDERDDGDGGTSSSGGRRGGSSTRAGHGVRGSSSIRGTAENGCAAMPVGLTNRLPSK